MAKRKICQAMAVVLALGMCTTGLTGCGNEKRADGKTEIEVVSYKPEAVKEYSRKLATVAGALSSKVLMTMSPWLVWKVTISIILFF